MLRRSLIRRLNFEMQIPTRTALEVGLDKIKLANEALLYLLLTPPHQQMLNIINEQFRNPHNLASQYISSRFGGPASYPEARGAKGSIFPGAEASGLLI